PDRREDVGDDAPAAWKARHIVEQHRLVADAALVDVDDAADLLLALGAGDVLQFAVGAQLRDPGAQILTLFGCCLFRGASFDCRIHVSSESHSMLSASLGMTHLTSFYSPAKSRRHGPFRWSCGCRAGGSAQQRTGDPRYP